MSRASGHAAGRWVALGAALLVLNAAVTFHNVWPTFGITPRAELSIELAMLVLVLAAYRELVAPLPRAAPYLVTSAFVVLTIGRYADVTAPALYGRPVNFYWDAPHLPAVAAMLAEVAEPWMLAAGGVAFAAALVALVGALHWCVTRVLRALEAPRARRVLGGAAAGVTAFYGVATLADWTPRHWYALPVSATYWRQAEFLLEASGGGTARELPIEPLASSNLERVAGDDVLLMFLESYGAVAYDSPAIAAVVAPARAELAAAVEQTGRHVVSAYVRSPTFGGASWLAHATLMSGFELEQTPTYNLLLTQERETLPKRFAAAGYRAIAWMPGLRNPWPEGRFYGFDEIVGERDLDYRGPDFGWWRIPDQYALAKLHARELVPAPRPPVFVFFPTINTHVPFRPTPPLQTDWSKLLGAEPFAPAAAAASNAAAPEWLNLAPAYAATLAYTYAYVASYVRERAPRDLVLLLVGDHQPAASVSGQGARWDVPVHLITERADLASALSAAGFIAGMDLPPGGAPVASMRELTTVLLEAFDGGDWEGKTGFGPVRESAR